MNSEKLKLTTIIIIFSITGVGFAFSSTTVPIDSIDLILGFDSGTVTASSSTFTEILGKSTSTVSPTTQNLGFDSNSVNASPSTFTEILAISTSTVSPTTLILGFDSNSVTASSITSIRVVSTNPDATIGTVSGTDVEFISQLAVVITTSSTATSTTVSGTVVEFISQLAVVTTTSATPTVSSITGQTIEVNQIIIDPTTTDFIFESTDGITEIIVTDSGITLNVITIPSDVSNTTIDAGDTLTTEGDGSKSVTFTNGFTIDASTSNVDVDVVLPDGIKITGPSTWDGIINLPTFKPLSSVSIESGTITSVIEIGSGDTPLTFDIPVQIKFEGKGGQNVFFTRSGVTTEVTADCSGNTLSDNTGLPAGGDCKTTVGNDLFVWTKHFTLVSTSSTSTTSGGGGSGDSTPPSFITTFDETDYPFSINGNNYSLDQLNNIIPVSVETGKPLKLQIKMFDNGGTQNIQHVSLFVNQHGNKILNDLSETSITFEKGKDTEIIDPHNLIESASIVSSTQGNKAVFDFEVVFSKEMDTSDLLFRIWDIKRNSVDLHVPESLIVMLAEPTAIIEDVIFQEPNVESTMDAEPIFSWDKFNQWAGYSESELTDKEFLEHVGIEGNDIPDWVKENNAKWVKDGEMTQEELVIVLKYLESS